MKLTPKKHEELHEQMTQRLSQKVREMFEPRSIASRIYPKLKTRADDDEPKRPPPIQGWSHLRKEK